MALANLSINVTANTGDAVINIGKVRDTTNSSMREAAAAIGGFQSDVSKSSANIGVSARDISNSMTSAGDAIAKTAATSRDQINSIAATAQNIDLGGIGAQVSASMNDLDGAKSKFYSYAEDVKGYAERTAIFMGAALVTGISAAIFSAAYAAYKSIGFLSGLITGESYKSANIDALIAANDKVLDLQKSLQLTAVDANALNDAITRLGVDKGDYTAVVSGVASTLRGDREELDRLGVKYKDVNGNLLQTATIVENVKKKLDEYTTGWDRNQAAAAIGMGTYDQINAYLRVNQEEVQRSKERLDEYTLGIGPETQKAVAEYQQAMRDFNNETRLTSEGFKRAMADQVMPALTVTANFLRDGWPVAVRVFRYTMAEITSLAWGLKTSLDIVIDVAKGGVMIVVEAVAAAGKAAALAAQGDFKGAWEAIAQGYDKMGARVNKTSAEMVADAQRAARAMRQAWGFDSMLPTNGGKPETGGKSWVAAPDKPADQTDLWAQAHAKYLEYMKAFNAVEAEGTKAAAALNLELNRQAYDWGLIDYKTYLDKKHAFAVDSLNDQIAIKKKERDEFGKEADKYADGKDAKDAIAYHDALKKQATAEKELIKLEGDLKVLRAQNAEELKKATSPAVEVERIRSIKRALAETINQTPDFWGNVDEAAQVKARFEEEKTVIQERINYLKAQNLVELEEYKLQKQRLEAVKNAESASLTQIEMNKWKAVAATMNSNIKSISQSLMSGSKEQFRIGKALAMTMATIDTYQAASAAFAGGVKAGGGGPWGVALGVGSAALAVAAGMVNVAQIDSQQYQGREFGGPVNAGQTYVVGEKRPELFTPSTSGHITPYVPNGKTVHLTQVIQVSTGVSDTVRAEIANYAPVLAQMAVSAVRADIEGGGDMARAVGRA